jgi:hypothetical protein
VEINITITDPASSIEQQVSVSGPSGYVSGAPATDQGATHPAKATLAGINAGPAPAVMSDVSVVPITDQGAALSGTGALTDINAGPAPAPLTATSAVGLAEFVTAAESAGSATSA